MRRSLQIAWLAGLFDGEGCVLTRWPKKREVTLEIKMVHKPTIERVASIVGGNVTKRSRNGGFGRRVQWRWRVSDKAAMAVAEMLLPYLCEKQEQVAAAMHFKAVRTDAERDHLAAYIKDLKRVEYVD